MMEEQQQTKTGRIYKISSPQTDNVYIGSTTQSIKERLSKHKSDYKRYVNKKCSYVSSYELVKFMDVIIELIEEVEYIHKSELLRRERFYIEHFQNNVNKHRPITTKEEMKTESKNYYLENRELKIDKQKAYYMENKEKINQLGKEYRNKNKLLIQKRKSQKCECECGSTYTHGCKLKHMRSKKHTNYITNHITLNITINDGGVANITTTK